MTKRRFVLLGLLAVTLVGIGGAGSLGQYGGYGTSSPAGYTVLIGYNPRVGSYLIDAQGMTLYYFAKDVTGQSACVDGCLERWPIFYTEEINVPPGLDPEDFGVITRPDGKKQTTYKGWPLYYFFMDAKPGEINGEGKGNNWFVIKIPFYTVMVGYKEELGHYLVDANGRTLYYFKNDEPGVSNCTGGCLEKWPAFYAEEIITPSTVDPANFGEITRPEGAKQTTFMGWPLYYFFKDANRGDTNGQGVKDVWFVVNPFTFAP